MSERTTAQRPPTDWNRRILWGAVGLGLVIVLYLFSAAFLPRWWAQRVGDQVGKSFAGGVWWGLFYGVVFTLLPLVVARQALRKRWRWQTRVGIVLGALLLGSPNLMTLGIVWGDGNAAHAGERILDVEAPAFRGASLVGAIGGALAAGIVQYLVISRRRRGSELKKMRADDRVARRASS